MTTGQIWDKEIEERLKTEMEGNLYEHIYIHYFGNSYHVSKNYYAVLGGIVYSLYEADKRPSHDSLFNTHTECHLVGKYSEATTYKSHHVQLTSSQLNRKLFPKKQTS